jgi:hypothetical protein
MQIRFGQYNIAIECQDYDATAFLKLHFEDYLTQAFPDATIKIGVIPSDRVAILKSIKRYDYFIDGVTFNYGPNLIHGYWDRQNMICDIKICDFILSRDYVWLFDRFLCRIFYTLSLERRDEQIELIIHCAGIERQGKCYIFFGGPESGKSTVASYSKKINVLHDDMNIVSIDKKSAFVEGVPFNPKLIKRINSIVPLSMIFSLHKADIDKIEKKSRDEFIQNILPEVFLPMPLLSENRKVPLEYLIDSIRKLSECVPYYKLYFQKNNTFWNLIDAEEEGKNE